MMNHRSTLVAVVGLWAAVSPSLAADSVAESRCFSVDDFADVEKIDIHCHLHMTSTDFVALARKDRFSFLNIATQSVGPEEMRQRLETVLLQHRANPDRVAAVTSFSMEGWDQPDWQQRTIQALDESFAQGAVGVKVWKNIGMVARDASGELIMIDNPKLDPIFDHLQRRGIVLMGHLGEPRNCWLPLDEMTVNNDRNYFRRNPQYHMYLHPEMPSYQDQIDARDRMLAKHMDLPFLAAHLASLEWSVEQLGEFLDRFPNAVVGVAARLGQLQYQSQQDRDKVVAFLNKYQDRILYGTDTGVGPDSSIADAYEHVRTRWLRDWKYFNTNEMITVPELDNPVRGLALNRQVVEKIYRTNARNLFPTSWSTVSK